MFCGGKTFDERGGADLLKKLFFEFRVRLAAAQLADEFVHAVGPRRAGDPARIVATGELAARDLDWQMRHSLEDMVASAWRARKAAGQAVS